MMNSYLIYTMNSNLFISIKISFLMYTMKANLLNTIKGWRMDTILKELLRRRIHKNENHFQADKTVIGIFAVVDHCVSTLTDDPVKLQQYLDE